MGKKKIGTDVIGKIKPTKTEFEINLPPHFLKLRLTWEKQENRTLSDEEFRMRLQKYLEESKQKQSRREKQPKFPSDTKYVWNSSITKCGRYGLARAVAAMTYSRKLSKKTTGNPSWTPSWKPSLWCFFRLFSLALGRKKLQIFSKPIFMEQKSLVLHRRYIKIIQNFYFSEKSHPPEVCIFKPQAKALESPSFWNIRIMRRAAKMEFSESYLKSFSRLFARACS